MGHNGAVRDARFDPSGRHFISASYDRHVKYWDTETGACIASYTNGKVPYCAVFYPDDPHIFLVGNANRKILQVSFARGACMPRSQRSQTASTGPFCSTMCACPT